MILPNETQVEAEAVRRNQLLEIATTATDAAAKLLQIAAAASEALKASDARRVEENAAAGKLDAWLTPTGDCSCDRNGEEAIESAPP